MTDNNLQVIETRKLKEILVIFEIINGINDCTQREFDKLLELSIPKAKIISLFFNKKLGFRSYISLDGNRVIVDDNSLIKLKLPSSLNSLKEQSEFLEFLRYFYNILKLAKDNSIDILWAQTGILKFYYNIKQHGFNIVNLLSFTSALSKASATGKCLNKICIL